MTKIFEAIDAINWEELEHAYGSAADVPEDLKRLLEQMKKLQKRLFPHFGAIFIIKVRFIKLLLMLFRF